MKPIAESSMVNEPLVDDRSRELDGSSIDPRPTDDAGANKSVMRWLVRTLMLVVALIGGGVFALYKMHVDIPQLHTSKMYAYLDSIGMRTEQMKGGSAGQDEANPGEHEAEGAHHEDQKIVVTSPLAKDVVITQDYVCQIHSRRHIDVCAVDSGYLAAIAIKEGQAVKANELMFEIVPVLYKARRDAELAERDLARLELNNTKRLAAKQGVSQNEVKLYEAKLARAQAKADLAQAELNFATVRAPFDGIVDRLHEQLGSLIKEGDVLTTLSDNSVMWVYFNVREAQYLEYKASQGKGKENPSLLKLPDSNIEVMLADGSKFKYGAGDTVTVEGQFNNQTGNIAFRADFPNPDGLLRHGQTGTVLIHQTLHDAIVIPQRATFELLDKRYVWVVDKDDVAHQRLITIKHEKDDIFVINSGLNVTDKIVLEGVRQVEEGGKVKYEFRKPEDALKNQKFHAE